MATYPNTRELFNIIASTPGSNDKKLLIAAHNNPVIEQIFHDTYDKSVKYHVKKFTMPDPEIVGINTIDENYGIFHDALTALANRTVTGNEAIGFIEGTIMSYVAEDREILKRILDRNLKIGVSLENYNDALGVKSIKKYEVALAKKIQDLKNVDIFDGTYYVSRKLDGVRTTIHIHNGYDMVDGEFHQEVKFISRQGKAFTTLNKLIPSIKKVTEQLMGDWVLDGETCLVDENGKENFRGLMSEVTRKNHVIENPKFMWFDLVRLSEFSGEKKSPDFENRYSMMCELYYESGAPKDIEVLLQCWMPEGDLGEQVFNTEKRKADKEGWEGLMLRKNVPYRSGRTDDLIKVKNMQDAEYIVEGVEFGKATYNEGGAKEYDIASALTIRHKGNIVKVGSGLSKLQRLRWFSHPDEIIGKTITVQYFEETQDKKTGAYSLRFPILKYVYENGREI